MQRKYVISMILLLVLIALLYIPARNVVGRIWLGFIQAQYRTNTGRTKARMRNIADVLEKMKVNDGVYPIPGENESIVDIFVNNGLSMSEGWDLYYVDWKPLKGSPAELDEQFRYISNGEKYLLLSKGPNRKFDFSMTSAGLDQDNDALRLQIIENEYDPTNGVISSGDIIFAGVK